MTLPEETLPAACFEGALPVLETERLVLRAPLPEDAATLATLLNDRRIAENTASIPFPYALADAEAFIDLANRDGDEPTFVITLAEGPLIGTCKVARFADGNPEPGYWIGIPYWGHGYATEALRGLLDHAFGDLRYEHMQGRARVSNPASRRVLEKCGFQWSGVALTRVRALGSSVPVDRFRLDRGLWASLKSWGKVRRVA